MPVQVIIPSRKRPGAIPEIDHLFPDAVWCIGADEADAYAVPAGRKLIHPPDVLGIARKRQWIMENSQGTILMADDDVRKVWCNVGRTGHEISGSENIRQIVENAAHIAEEIGAPIFGFDQSWDVRMFRPFDPLRFTGWVGTVIGFTRHDLQFDTNLVCQGEDIDICLQGLLKQRIIFVDHRFAFVCQRFTNAGGMASVRSSEQYELDKNRMLRKWGQWISAQKVKTTIRIIPRVPRRQHLDIEL
jgi:hypothetical protein